MCPIYEASSASARDLARGSRLGDDAGEDEHVDAGRPGPQQGARRGVGRRARRQDVVDENEIAVRHANGGLRRDMKGALHVGGALVPGETDLRDGGAAPAERLGIDGDAAGSRDGVGERVRLVEATGEQPAAMQRHRHEQVRLDEKLGPGPRHPGADRLRQFEPVAILQPVDEMTARTVLEARHGAGPGEGRRPRDGVGRQETVAAEVRREGRPQPLAERPLDEAGPPPARGAKGAVPVGRRAAGETGRRKDEIERETRGAATGRPDRPPKTWHAARRARYVDRHHAGDVMARASVAPEALPATRPRDEMSAPLLFDRSLLRRRLARAGDGNVLLERIRDELLDRLAVVKRSFHRVADVGTPGPTLAAALAERGADVTRLAPVIERHRPSVRTIVGDEERLPFREGALDLVVSALSLQHCNDLPGALLQIRRALKPDGFFLAACLGGGTLRELRAALATAESELLGGISPRIAPFVEVRDAGALLQRAGFALPVADADGFTLRYADMFGLLADLRRFGATNPLAARARRPAPRRLFLRAADVYAERFADPDGRVRATIEVLYLAGWSPHASQQKPLRPGSARMRLADALKPT